MVDLPKRANKNGQEEGLRVKLTRTVSTQGRGKKAGLEGMG